MHHVAVLVAQHLKFNVPRAARSASRYTHWGCRRPARPRRARSETRRASSLFLRTTRMPRPPPPSAALIITGNPISAAISFAACFIGHDARAARNDRQPGCRHLGARAVLLAHHANHVGRGSDKGDVRGLADLGKIGVLGEKTVARMDRVDVGDFRRADHLRNIQIALAAARRPDANGLIGKAHMQGIAVRLGINGDRVEFPVLCRRSECAARFRRGWRSEFFETFDCEYTRKLQHCAAQAPADRDRLRREAVISCAGPDAEKRLAVFHRMPFSTKNLGHFARHIRFDFVHQLHRFDDAEHLARLHARADGDKRLRAPGSAPQ